MTTEIISAATAVVSAVVAIASALIAFLSFVSARNAQKATELAARRSALREVAVTADAIVLEARRVESLAIHVKGAYGSLAAFSGALLSRKHEAITSAVEEKARTATDLVGETRALGSNATLLSNAKDDDIHTTQTRLEQNLNRVRAIREDFERELASIESKCAVYRENNIKRLAAMTQPPMQTNFSD